MKSRLYILSMLILPVLLPGRIQAQEIDLDSLLIREVEVENPTYMPIVGFGTGTTHFFGEVINNYRTPLSSHYGFKVNVSSPPFDRRRTFLVNFYLMLGEVSGNERSITEMDRNLNFSSNLTALIRGKPG